MPIGLWRNYAIICAMLAMYGLAANWVATGTSPWELIRIMLAWLPWSSLAALLSMLGMVLAIVATGLFVLSRPPLAGLPLWKGGTFYGILVYFVVFGVVLPLSSNAAFPDPDPWRVAAGLFPCVVLVGWPLAQATGAPLFKRRPSSS